MNSQRQSLPMRALTGELWVDTEVVQQLHDLADDALGARLRLDVAVLQALDGPYERVHVFLGLHDLRRRHPCTRPQGDDQRIEGLLQLLQEIIQGCVWVCGMWRSICQMLLGAGKAGRLTVIAYACNSEA